MRSASIKQTDQTGSNAAISSATVVERPAIPAFQAPAQLAVANKEERFPGGFQSGFEPLAYADLGDIKAGHGQGKGAQLKKANNAPPLNTGTKMLVQFLKRPAVPVLQNKSDEPASSTELFAQQNDPSGQRKVAQTGVEKPRTASTQKPIQRKVGFEFESQDQIIKKNDRETDKAFNKKDILIGDGFKVIGDEAKLEIVTDAVDETSDGRGLLVEQIGRVVTFLTQLRAGRNPINALEGNRSDEAKLTASFIELAGGVDALPFHPQSTAGVKLEGLTALMDAFLNAPQKGVNKAGGGEAWAGRELAAGQRPDAYANQIGWDARHEYPEMKTALNNAREKISNDLSPKVKSLLYLGTSYAESVAAVEPSQRHTEAKFWMSFMSRSDLSSVYKTLDHGEKKEFNEALEELKDSLGGSFSLDKGSDAPHHVSFHDWMNTLEDRDQISGFATGYGEIDGESKKYDMNSATDIGIDDLSAERRQGLVLELRSLGANVTPPSFRAFAMNVFDLIKAVNTPAVAPAGVGGAPAPVAVDAPVRAPVAEEPPIRVDGGAKAEGAAGGGGGKKDSDDCCFITTACCEFMGLPDDCEELTALRWFRDNYMMTLPQGKELIRLYYKVAPTIVNRINRHREREELLAYLYKVITGCVSHIGQRNYLAALHTYSVMTKMLTQLFYPEFKI